MSKVVSLPNSKGISELILLGPTFSRAGCFLWGSLGYVGARDIYRGNLRYNLVGLALNLAFSDAPIDSKLSIFMPVGVFAVCLQLVDH